jgi:hypothetical protein
MNQKEIVNESIVRTISDVAALSLAKDREMVISPALSQWIRDANELSKKMSAAKYWEMIPITVFRHQK